MELSWHARGKTGVGLDIEIIVGDVSFQDVSAVTVSPAGLARMPRAELSAATRAPGWASRRLVWRPSRLSSGDYPFPLCLDAADRCEQRWCSRRVFVVLARGLVGVRGVVQLWGSMVCWWSVS